MEPNYRKFRGTIHLKHLMEAGRLYHNTGTLSWINHSWKNDKSMMYWYNMLGCCKTPKCMYDHVPNQKTWTMHRSTMCAMSSENQSNGLLTITPPFKVLIWEEMGGLGVEMVEILEMEGRVVAMNATEVKTTKMTIMDEQVVVPAETTAGHKEGAAAGNANTTEGAPKAGQ